MGNTLVEVDFKAMFGSQKMREKENWEEKKS